MLNNKQIVKGVIHQIDENQNGILKVQKDNVLVRHVLLQEEVKVSIRKRSKEGYIGDVVEIIKPSSERQKVVCPIYNTCGSCQMMHMTPSAQSQYKKKQVQNLCKKAKLSCKVQDVLSMDQSVAYRNKIIVGFLKDKNHKVQAGFYEELTHRIVPYTSCVLHPNICDEIIQSIVQLMNKFRIEPYDEDRKRGLLRHVIIRYGTISKQIMVVLVVNSNVFPARKNFVQALLQKHREITTVVQNVNTRKTSIVLGEQERVLYGKGYIEDELLDCKYRISAKSFYQINHEQTEVLYQKAIELLALKGHETVLDAYCGIGTIGMYVSRYVKQVLGVEVNKDAIHDANANASANHIKNIRFVCDDASKFMSKLTAKKERLDVVIMDPPRSGSSEEFIRSVSRSAPAKVLYISCNPQTQVRDILIFQKYGYHLASDILLVDLFPNTMHVESVVLMTRK
ncbi:MAG: 23S rRNA (uracil(1939)-C(5))-methyltransferase RlmD [Longicatena sp.]